METGKTNSGHTTNNANDGMINNNPFIPDVPFHPYPLLRQPIKQNTTHEQNSQNEQNISPNINFDFEENSPFQEGFMSETFQRPDKSFFQNPTELGDLINKGNFIHKYLPKQTDIDKILEVIQRKVLKGTYLLWKLKKFKWDICVVHILKIYICICYKTNSHLQNQQLESWKHQQKSIKQNEKHPSTVTSTFLIDKSLLQYTISLSPLNTAILIIVHL